MADREDILANFQVSAENAMKTRMTKQYIHFLYCSLFDNSKSLRLKTSKSQLAT